MLSVGLGIPCVFAFFVLLPQGQEGELGAAVPYIALAFAFGFDRGGPQGDRRVGAQGAV